MESTVLVSCALNQWGMDFEGNSTRIIESIVQAKRFHNAKIRLGSQSEVPGFSVEDHFLEPDTILHSWQVLGRVLEVTKMPPYNDILCVIGMPVYFRGVIYNAAVVIYSGEVKLIRPKSMLANDTLHRENRWFTSWTGGKNLMEYSLPEFITEISGQKFTTIGNALIQTDDNYLLGLETLEEAKSPAPTSSEMLLMGAHIILNVGGNPFTLDGYDEMDCIRTSTNKAGGIYMYSSSVGFDGSRTYFDSQSLIICNGKCLASTNAYSLKEVDLAVATVDLAEINIYRSAIASRNVQAAAYICDSLQTVKVHGLRLRMGRVEQLTQTIPFPEYSREEQVGRVPACYLWDYLRRSLASGFFIPISGGVGSISVLAIVSKMCKLVLHALPQLIGYNRDVMAADLVRIFGEIPKTYTEMMSKVVYTAYLSTENTSEESKIRACDAATELGATHLHGSIQEIYDSYLETFISSTSPKSPPRFLSEGGSLCEDIALQSLQSRIRMVVSYISGQLLHFAYNRQGFLIVLATSSLEQNICGYFTKYGNSSGDINPIGCISKLDLKLMLLAISEEFPSLRRILEAEVRTELRPERTYAEKDLEIGYEEIVVMARMRKENRYGPLTMFMSCCEVWDCEPEEVARRVKRFFLLYANNRHKMTVVTPMIHMDVAGTDDNRFDLRQFLYNVSWTAQFGEIDQALAELKRI